MMMQTANTTTALLSMFPAGPLADGTAVQTMGRTSVGDCGGALLRYDASDTTSADNGGTVRVDSVGRRWKIIHDGSINVGWFGGTVGAADLGAPFAAAWNVVRAIGQGVLIVPPIAHVWTSQQLLSGDFNNTGVVTVRMDGASIDHTGTGFALTLDGLHGLGSSFTEVQMLGWPSIHGNALASGFLRLNDMSNGIYQLAIEGYAYMPAGGVLDGTQGCAIRLSCIVAWCESNRFIDCSFISCTSNMIFTNDGSGSATHLRTIVQNAFCADGTADKRGIHFWAGDGVLLGGSRFVNLKGNFANRAIFSLGQTNCVGTVIDGLLMEANGILSGRNKGIVELRDYPSGPSLQYFRPRIINIDPACTASGGGTNLPIWMDVNDHEVFPEAMYAQPVALNSGAQIIGRKAMFDRAMNANWLNGGNTTPMPPPAMEGAGLLVLRPGSPAGTVLPGEDQNGSLKIGVGMVEIYGGNTSAVLTARIKRSDFNAAWIVSDVQTVADGAGRVLSLVDDGSGPGSALVVKLSGAGADVPVTYHWNGILY